MSWRRTEIYRENLRTGDRRWGVIFENYERQLVLSVIGFAERKQAAAFAIVDTEDGGVLAAQLEKRDNAPQSQPNESRFHPQAQPESGQAAQPGASEKAPETAHRDWSRGPVA